MDEPKAPESDGELDAKSARKQRKAALKAARRAKREQSPEETGFQEAPAFWRGVFIVLDYLLLFSFDFFIYL